MLVHLLAWTLVERLPSLEAVLQCSDFLTLHVPMTASTRGIIGESQLALMKPDAVIINTARGGVVDEAGTFTLFQTVTLLQTLLQLT
jgi:D-3-phosphoglycerate dehydrogenase / 2-oxoglutarate reductase